MAKETSEIKKRDDEKVRKIARSNKLKAAIKAAKKLNYSDLQQLNKVTADYLEAHKQKQIDYLEQQLKLIKER